MLKKKANLRAAEEEEKKETGEEAKTTRRTTGAELRFRKDLSSLDVSEGITVESGDDEATQLKIKVDLSKYEDSMWYGGTYDFLFEIKQKYPIAPPEVTMTGAPIWHPNIDEDGAVCLNILKPVTVGGSWKP